MCWDLIFGDSIFRERQTLHIYIFKNSTSSNETKTDKDIISDDKTKTIQELDREKLEKKFSKEDKEKLN